MRQSKINLEELKLIEISNFETIEIFGGESVAYWIGYGMSWFGHEAKDVVRGFVDAF